MPKPVQGELFPTTPQPKRTDHFKADTPRPSNPDHGSWNAGNPQLPLMATAREIRSSYQAVHGDREVVGTYTTHPDFDHSGSQPPEFGVYDEDWGGTVTAGKGLNRLEAGVQRGGGKTGDTRWKRGVAGKRQYGDSLLETDNELFDRKAAEAENGNSDDYFEGGGLDSPTLADSIRMSGHNIKNPISLQIPKEKNSTTPLSGSQFDQAGRPSDHRPKILGGHHRVAVMHNEAKDKLMPVDFSDSVMDARISLGDRY
jgi:hypothetical protein